jgi:hypothetical protein
MIFGNPSIVTNGLILNLDAANTKSYPRTGTSWRDLSGNNNTGTLTNGPTFNSLNGGSIVFNGTNQYAELGSIPSLQFTNTQPFSISVWFRWTEATTAADNIYAYALLSGNNRGYYVGLDGGAGTVVTNGLFFDYFDGTTFRGIQSGTNSISKNIWYNVAVTSNSNSFTGMKIYLNGSILATTVRTSGNGTPSSINYTGLTAQVGARQATSTFGGNIGFTSIYNRELSASEIQQNYNALKSRFNLR